MKKDDISFALIGIFLGLVIGFISANNLGGKPGAAQPSSGSTQTAANPGGSDAQLPANHPPVDPNKPVQARPLSPGQVESAKSAPSQTEAHGATGEFPLLDPLPASSKEQRAEQKYKNIQVLKGIPAERLENLMFAFKDSLGVECTHCHVPDHFEKDEKPAKQMARKMIGITRDANAKLGGATRVTCFTCHRGQLKPAQQ